MINIKVDIDTRGLAQFMQFSERRLNAAVATALTRTAVEARKSWQQELRTKLDRPTPYTTNSVRVESANANKLEAVVAIKDQGADGTVLPAEYLGTQQRGGTRNLRKFERALVNKGAMLPGYRVVLARYALVDGYGNVTRGQIVQVLNQLGAGLSEGYRQVISRSATKRAASARRSGRQYVAFPRDDGNIFAGIWQRKGRALLPVFQFVRTTMYRSRIDLYQRARDVVGQQLQAQFDRAMRESAARLAAK